MAPSQGRSHAGLCKPQALAGRVNGGDIVPSGDHARNDHEQDAEQARGNQAQYEVAPSLSLNCLRA